MEITYAKINDKDIVDNVIVASHQYILSLENKDDYIETFLDANGEKERFYNFASIGFKFDRANNAFIAPKPFDSWVLDKKFQWQPPILMPTDGKFYQWDESTISWVETT